MDRTNIRDLIGKTIKEISLTNSGPTYIRFTTTDGQRFYVGVDDIFDTDGNHYDLAPLEFE